MMLKFVVLAFVLGVVSADNEGAAEVKSFDSDVLPDGSYHYSYDTSNGISAQESGTGGVSASGSVKFKTPEGVDVSISYVADENGYQPQGDSIPVPPAIPESVLRALAWNEKHPNEE